MAKKNLTWPVVTGNSEEGNGTENLEKVFVLMIVLFTRSI